MVKHIVLYTLKEGVDKAQAVSIIRESLEPLVGVIPGLTHMEIRAAYQGGMWAINTLGKDIKAVVIYGQEGDNTSNLRRAGYEKACEEAGVEVLASLSGQNTTDGATKTMEDMLSAHGDAIDVVFCHNDDTAIGAMNACKSAGITGVTIVGFDGNASAIELIASGDLAGTPGVILEGPYGKVELIINVDQKIGEVDLVAAEDISHSELMSGGNLVFEY